MEPVEQAQSGDVGARSRHAFLRERTQHTRQRGVLATAGEPVDILPREHATFECEQGRNGVANSVLSSRAMERQNVLRRQHASDIGCVKLWKLVPVCVLSETKDSIREKARTTLIDSNPFVLVRTIANEMYEVRIGASSREHQE